MKRSDILRVFTILSDTYPGWAERSADTQPDTWLVLLGDIPIERLVVAAVTHAQQSKFPPTPAELRDRAEIRPSSAPEEAWALCKRVAGMISPYASSERFAELRRAIAAKDPCALDALDSVGGISLFHTQSVDDVPTNRAHFARAYTAITERRRREADESLAIETLTRRPGPALRTGEPRKLIDEPKPDGSGAAS